MAQLHDVDVAPHPADVAAHALGESIPPRTASSMSAGTAALLGETREPESKRQRSDQPCSVVSIRRVEQRRAVDDGAIRSSECRTLLLDDRVVEQLVQELEVTHLLPLSGHGCRSLAARRAEGADTDDRAVARPDLRFEVVQW